MLLFCWFWGRVNLANLCFILETLIKMCYTHNMEKSEKKSFWSRLNPFGKGKNGQSKKKVYSNTQNTVWKIKKTLIQLLTEKELSEISTTSLVKDAGVYRATFYLHYRNINAVINDIESDVFAFYEELKEQIMEIDIFNNIGTLLDVIKAYIAEDKQYFQVIVNARAFSRLVGSLKDLFQQTLLENFVKYQHIADNSPKYNLNVSVFAGAMVFAFKDWVNDETLDFEQLKKLARNMGRELFGQIKK